MNSIIVSLYGGKKNQDELTAASKVYGSVDLYVGDDGRIYSN